MLSIHNTDEAQVALFTTRMHDGVYINYTFLLPA
jgi:hypothetical protein